MHEIICPHCHKAFKVDEAGYADILKQVRDKDFEQQLHERLHHRTDAARTQVDLMNPRGAGGFQLRGGRLQVLLAFGEHGQAALRGLQALGVATGGQHGLQDHALREHALARREVDQRQAGDVGGSRGVCRWLA